MLQQGPNWLPTQVTPESAPQLPLVLGGTLVEDADADADVDVDEGGSVIKEDGLAGSSLAS